MHTSIPCRDFSPCTVDFCDPANGLCVHSNVNCVDFTNLTIKSVASASSVQFKRKQGRKGTTEFVKIIFKEVLVASIGNEPPARHKISIKTFVTGADRSLVSLLYPLAVLDGGPGALDALHLQGFDFDVMDESILGCRGQLPAQKCADLATHLSKSIDASLASTDAPERDGFRQGAAALGHLPDTCTIIL